MAALIVTVPELGKFRFGLHANLSRHRPEVKSYQIPTQPADQYQKWNM